MNLYSLTSDLQATMLNQRRTTRLKSMEENTNGKEALGLTGMPGFIVGTELNSRQRRPLTKGVDDAFTD